MASAKLANRTVNHSQSAIWNWKARLPPPVTTSRTRKMVVIAAPTSTTNITGFFISVSGFSFANEARTARLTISGSNRGRDRASFLGRSEVGSSGGICGVTVGSVVVVAMLLAPKLSAVHQEMLDDRTERKRREEGQRTNDQDGADEQSDEQRSVRGKCSRGRRDFLLGGEASGRGKQRDQEQESADPHRETDSE